MGQALSPITPKKPWSKDHVASCYSVSYEERSVIWGTHLLFCEGLMTILVFSKGQCNLLMEITKTYQTMLKPLFHCLNIKQKLDTGYLLFKIRQSRWLCDLLTPSFSQPISTYFTKAKWPLNKQNLLTLNPRMSLRIKPCSSDTAWLPYYLVHSIVT